MSSNSHLKFYIKNKIFAHIEIWRPYTVIWCGLVSLAGACLANEAFPSLTNAILVTIIPMMGWIAGLYLSDYLDRELDTIQKPHRPIPSGRIKPKEALIVGGTFALIGFLLSFTLTINNVILVFIVAFLVFTYANVSKSRGLAGNVNRGLVTVVAFFFGIFSVDKPIAVYIWILSLVFLIHDSNSNIIGAIRDVEGDKKGGYITIPVKYGIKKTLIIALLLSIIYYLIILSVVFSFNFLQYYYRFFILFLLAVCIICVMYISLFKSIITITRKKALQAHEFFVAERITLASAFIFGIVDSLLISTSIFALAFIITIISQLLIRKRYEFKENL